MCLSELLIYRHLGRLPECCPALPSCLESLGSVDHFSCAIRARKSRSNAQAVEVSSIVVRIVNDVIGQTTRLCARERGNQQNEKCMLHIISKIHCSFIPQLGRPLAPYFTSSSYQRYNINGQLLVVHYSWQG